MQTKNDGTKLKEHPASSSNDLLGCPWCGVLPEYQPRAQGHTDESGHTYHWPHTINHNCKVIGRQICIRCDYSKCEDTKEAVTAVWNTRWQPND